jgi:hypothetical protein
MSKEKKEAHIIYNDMREIVYTDRQARKCALYLVDKVLDIKSVNKDFELSNYWQEVRNEIEVMP